MSETPLRKKIPRFVALPVAAGALITGLTIAHNETSAAQGQTRAAACPPPNIKLNPAGVSGDELLQAEGQAIQKATERVVKGQTLRYIGCVAHFNQNEQNRTVTNPIQTTENGINLVGYIDGEGGDGLPLIRFASINDVTSWSISKADPSSIAGNANNQVVFPVTNTEGFTSYDYENPFDANHQPLVGTDGAPLPIGLSDATTPSPSSSTAQFQVD